MPDTLPLRHEPQAPPKPTPAVLALTCDLQQLADAVAAQVVARLLTAQQAAAAAPEPADPGPQYLSRRDAAGRLGVSVGTVDNMIRDGRLKCVRIGRAVRIEAAELQRIVAVAGRAGEGNAP